MTTIFFWRRGAREGVKKSRSTARGGGAIGSLLRSSRGSVAVYLTLAAAVFLPIAAFVIDGTRYYGLNTELKNAADAAALAAATKMDFTDDGMFAADAAARNAVVNYNTFASDDLGGKIAINAVQFLTALPPAGETNYDLYFTTSGTDARYVRVVTETREISSAAMIAFSAWSDRNIDLATKTTAAAAVAAKNTFTCQVTPIMICNPIEDGANPIFGMNIDQDEYVIGPNSVGGWYEYFSDFLKDNPLWTRRQYRLKYIGNGSDITNGVFALLEPTFVGKKGAAGIREELALGPPDICILNNAANIVDVKTGQAEAINDGLNVRFDIYKGTIDPSPDYPTAPNVTKGYLPKNGNICAAEEVNDGATALGPPKDECFFDPPEGSDTLATMSPSCYAFGSDPLTIENVRYGNGVWNFKRYFEVSQPQIDLAAIEAAGDLPDFLEMIQSTTSDLTGDDPTDVDMAYGDLRLDTDPLPPSRFSVYLWELGMKADADGAFETLNYPGDYPLAADATWQGQLPTPDTNNPPNYPLLEEGGPQCNAANVMGPARRLLYLAMINCGEYADELGGGQRNNIPVQEYLEVFLNEPAAHGNGPHDEKGTIYVEVTRGTGPTSLSNIVQREIIQLY